MAAPPPDLCPEHKRIWRAWRDYRYDPRHPKDWGSLAPIADARTSHADRRNHWDAKNAQQMDLTVELCRTGRSPQCDREATPADLTPRP